MEFLPVNRHLLVKIQEEEKEQNKDSQILLPDDYRAINSPYTVCDVIGVSHDCELRTVAGDKVIVESSMINNIEYNDNIYSIVLENYVYGIINLGQ